MVWFDAALDEFGLLFVLVVFGMQGVVYGCFVRVFWCLVIGGCEVFGFGDLDDDFWVFVVTLGAFVVSYLVALVLCFEVFWQWLFVIFNLEECVWGWYKT